MPQCSSCYRRFRTPQALHAHCRDKADHAYCEECERLFVHFQALEQHLQYSPVHEDKYCRSRRRLRKGATASLRTFRTTKMNHHIHSPSGAHNARVLTCPLCLKTFTIPSAIAQHIESGACHNISRHQVTAAVHALQIVPTISITRRLQGPSAPKRIITYSASERAFNGSAYECYRCHRTFGSLLSLNAHLNSPAHDADEFACPKCKRRFKLVSGLVQHIESEVCRVARFQQVENFAINLSNRFSSRLLKF